WNGAGPGTTARRDADGDLAWPPPMRAWLWLASRPAIARIDPATSLGGDAAFELGADAPPAALGEAARGLEAALPHCPDAAPGAPGALRAAGVAVTGLPPARAVPSLRALSRSAAATRHMRA